DIQGRGPLCRNELAIVEVDWRSTSVGVERGISGVQREQVGGVVAVRRRKIPAPVRNRALYTTRDLVVLLGRGFLRVQARRIPVGYGSSSRIGVGDPVGQPVVLE